ncbi:MAG: SDR family oxidoreductase [Gallionella sp.]|nr:SDR family oxidoreductase [Gallionella sp.]
MNRLLIVGCGDIARRLIPLLTGHYRIFALIRNPVYRGELRALGVRPICGDLDERASLLRIAGIGQTVLHLAPPPNRGGQDGRTRNLLAVLSRAFAPQRLIYLSTSGVYGDCAGERIDETRPVNPQTARAQRRLDAEKQIRVWAGRNGVRASILRVPGIYAQDRLPLDRLRAGSPAFSAAEDGYTNHIHADDLARIIVSALRLGKAGRIYHASDDSESKMGDYFDEVAAAYGLPKPPRVSRAEAQSVLSPVLLSFMNESRRLANARMKYELRVRLRYATVAEMLSAAVPL